LWTFTGGCVRELLAKLKLMVTGRTLVLVHGHDVWNPPVFLSCLYTTIIIKMAVCQRQ
jgi:hypothetical protein